MNNTPRKRPAAQARAAQRATETKVACDARRPQPRCLSQIERKLPPSNETPSTIFEDERTLSPASPRLISKREIIEITGTSFPTLWGWMRRGQFPRSRVVGGRSMWLSTDIEAWMSGLPIRDLKPLADAGAA